LESAATVTPVFVIAWVAAVVAAVAQSSLP
jgi:hypothetical protein